MPDPLTSAVFGQQQKDQQLTEEEPQISFALPEDDQVYSTDPLTSVMFAKPYLPKGFELAELPEAGEIGEFRGEKRKERAWEVPDEDVTVLMPWGPVTVKRSTPFLGGLFEAMRGVQAPTTEEYFSAPIREAPIIGPASRLAELGANFFNETWNTLGAPLTGFGFYTLHNLARAISARLGPWLEAAGGGEYGGGDWGATRGEVLKTAGFESEEQLQKSLELDPLSTLRSLGHSALETELKLYPEPLRSIMLFAGGILFDPLSRVPELRAIEKFQRAKDLATVTKPVKGLQLGERVAAGLGFLPVTQDLLETSQMLKRQSIIERFLPWAATNESRAIQSLHTLQTNLMHTVLSSEDPIDAGRKLLIAARAAESPAALAEFQRAVGPTTLAASKTIKILDGIKPEVTKLVEGYEGALRLLRGTGPVAEDVLGRLPRELQPVVRQAMTRPSGERLGLVQDAAKVYLLDKVSELASGELKRIYQLRPPGPLQRFFNTVKALEAIAFLGLNPVTLVRNFTNNKVTLLVEGLDPWMSSDRMKKFFSDMGYSQGLLRVVREAGDYIRKAIDPKSKTYIAGFGGELAGRIAQLGEQATLLRFYNRIEVADRKIARVSGTMKAWTENARLGRWIPDLPESLRAAIPSEIRTALRGIIEANFHDPRKLRQELRDFLASGEGGSYLAGLYDDLAREIALRTGSPISGAQLRSAVGASMERRLDEVYERIRALRGPERARRLDEELVRVAEEVRTYIDSLPGARTVGMKRSDFIEAVNRATQIPKSQRDSFVKLVDARADAAVKQGLVRTRDEFYQKTFRSITMAEGRELSSETLTRALSQAEQMPVDPKIQERLKEIEAELWKPGKTKEEIEALRAEYRELFAKAKQLEELQQSVGGFFSRLEVALSQVKQTKFGSYDELKNFLKGRGVKEDEIFWSGLEEALGLHPKDPVTVEQIREIVSAKKPVLQLVELSGEKAKYSRYIEPGGFWYKEWLLLLRSELLNPVERRSLRDYSLKKAHWGEKDLPKGDSFLLASIRGDERPGLREGARQLYIDEIQSDLYQGLREIPAKGSTPYIYFEKLDPEEQEVVRSLAAFSFKVLDMPGFVEGSLDDFYRRAKALPEDQRLNLYIQEYLIPVVQAGFDGIPGIAKIPESLAEKLRKSRPVPEAPFGETWPELALKQILLKAATYGFDEIALARGRVHADRWGSEFFAWTQKVPESQLLEWEKAAQALEDRVAAMSRFGRMTDASVAKVLDELRTVSSKLRENVAALRAGSPDIVVVSYLEQYRGRIPGLVEDIGQEAITRGLIGPEKWVPAKNPEEFRLLYPHISIGSKTPPVEQLEKVFARIRQSPSSGTYLPRAEGLNYFYDERLPKALEKLVRPLGGRLTSTEDRWIVELTPEIRAAISAKGFPLFSRVETTTTRVLGSVIFDEERRALIQLSREANLSTLVHEFGHVLRRQISTEDLSTLASHYGLVDPQAWTREAEERFARDFQVYLMKSTAPSSVLERVFEKLKSALLRIYREVFGEDLSGAEINPEVKRVIDNLFKAEEAEAHLSREAAALRLASQPSSSPFSVEAQFSNEYAKAWGDLFSELLPGLRRAWLREAPATTRLSAEARRNLRGYVEGEVIPAIAPSKQAAWKLGDWAEQMAVLNYEGRTNADAWSLFYAPFWFWRLHSGTNWAQRFLDRPALALLYWKMKNLLTETEEDPAYPEKLRGRLKIPVPFLPEFLTGDVFVDPVGPLLPVEDIFARELRSMKYQRVYDSDIAAAIRALRARGLVSEEEASQALRTKRGLLWESTKQSLEKQVKEPSISSLTDLLQPHLPIDIIIKLATGHPEDISDLIPLTRMARNLPAVVTGRPGPDIEEPIRKLLRGTVDPGVPTFSLLEVYRAERAIRDMVARGEVSTEQGLKALIEHSGPVWEQAVSRAAQLKGYQELLALSGFPTQLLSEGEAKYYLSRLQRDRLIDESLRAIGLNPEAMTVGQKFDTLRQLGLLDLKTGSALARFIHDNPELNFASLLGKTEEQRLQEWLLDEFWSRYSNLSALDKRLFRQQQKDQQLEVYIDKETRDVLKVPLETLASWVQKLGGYLPVSQPSLIPSEVRRLETYKAQDPKLQIAYQSWLDRYLQIRETQSTYYQLPEGSEERRAFLREHPELREYWDFVRQLKSSNPELVKLLGWEQPGAGASTPAPTGGRTGGSGFVPTTTRQSTQRPVQLGVLWEDYRKQFPEDFRSILELYLSAYVQSPAAAEQFLQRPDAASLAAWLRALSPEQFRQLLSLYLAWSSRAEPRPIGRPSQLREVRVLRYPVRR